MKKIIVLIAAIFISAIAIYVLDECKVSTVDNCKVIELQQQQIISGNSSNVNTKIRYLIVTDKETFVCQNSLLNGKFNNSDIYWHLKKDSTYTFKVAGIGKSVMTEYRNILEVIK